MTQLEISKTYEAPYPFVLEEIDAPWDAELVDSSEWNKWVIPKIKSWRPGADVDEHEYGCDYYAHSMGVILLTVIQITEMPGRYHDRVFYTRQWRDPAGKVFGDKKLRVTTVGNFTTMRRGYRYAVELVGEAVAA